ncbi:MAG TPA: NAD(P)H-hydrate dehydratase [Candidatus Saccharimonadales bacterium]|nr:NAD(P)H-hydrate dehydratase [Candidatus Saccharimonadales bacterium]
MKALTAAEMREVDRLTTQRSGLSGVQLMENAGKSVCEYLLRTLGDEACMQAIILCGKGNNGGDGFICARLLQERGLRPVAYLFASPGSVRGDAGTALARLRESGAEVRVVPGSAEWRGFRGELASANLIVDALLGTGLKGPAEGLFAEVIQDVNKISRNCTSVSPRMVLAVDTPSGLPSDGEPATGPVLFAHATVTFTAPKNGQLVSRDAACCGRLFVQEIGSPPELVAQQATGMLRWMEPREFAHMPLVRKADSNKGNYGHVLLVAGSRGKSGAAILAGRGALRAGAGLLTVAVPEGEQHAVAAGQAEWMTHGLISTKGGATALANWQAPGWDEVLAGKTVLAVGPGLGMEEETQEFVRTLVRGTDLPIVLDADGLNAFAGRGSELRQRKSAFLAVTPHPGEMARLCGQKTAEIQADRLRYAVESAKEWNAHVVLKGFHTIVATPDGHLFVNTTGNPGMAKGGSGDVLAGIIAGMVAQFASGYPAESVALGVYLHGLAADDATVERGEATLLAGEITDALPTTVWRFIEELQRRD